ncbi:hypothetical protein KZC56_17385 [Microbacterium sp. SSW1-47]|uniref:hypothetical protein n=1 Tax=Microbacterium sufflavum TaxID=2851649 RepID=UPI001FFC505E|nr:hypothetical protein [Microbacterium sufflavum]MCK2028073.1 hypothetical protein [Microbacterium sufflavum]
MREEPAASELLDRLVRSVAATPDPIKRARECVAVGEELRTVQSRLANVRRQAIYEATLRPGATGRSVADELGVSAKTVSLASSEFRRQDLDLLRDLVEATESVAPDSPELLPAKAVIASSSSVGVVSHIVAALDLVWLRAASTDGDADTWEKTYQGFKRVEYLSKLARAQQPLPPRADAPAQFRTPARLQWLEAVLNAMPGVAGWASVDAQSDDQEWGLWWSIESADPNLEAGDVGPSSKGWLVSEWLVWLVRDYRVAGKRIQSSVTAPPPMINEPGAMMTFYITASLDDPDSVDPDEFAQSIIDVWDGQLGVPGTGYFDVNWPVKHP